MSGKIMKRLFEFRIFLSAMEAESLFQRVSAAKKRPIFSDFPMAHDINRGFRQINYLKKLNNQISIFLRIHLNLIMDFFYKPVVNSDLFMDLLCDSSILLL